MAINNLVIILGFITILFFFILCLCKNSKENYPLFSTDSVTVGTPPPLGDFLPTVGDVSTGDDDHVIMSSMRMKNISWLDSELCQECVNNCIALPTRFGLSHNSNRSKCVNRCSVECDPTNGL